MKTWFIIFSISVVTVVYACTVLLHMMLFKNPEVYYIYARSWSRILLRLAGVRVHVTGANNVRTAQRYVFVSNHASLFDIPVLLVAIPDNFRIMYKQELERIPIFGWCLKVSPFIAIKRERSKDASEALNHAIDSMKGGSSVLVFPEGTRSPDGHIQTFKRGAFMLATRSEKPIIPVTLVGTSSIMPARTKRIVAGNVEVVIHPEIPIEQPVSREQEKALLATVQNIIALPLPL